MKKTMIAGLVAAGLAITISGCATYTGQTNAPDDPNRTQRGALIGAAIGVAAGLLTGDDAVERRQHALVGAGLGAIAGGSVGAYQDRQEAELRRQMAGTGVDVVRKGDNITLNMPGNVTFDFDSASVKPQFMPVLDNVAQTLTQYDKTVIEVAGHTDNVGSDSYNQALSQRRANAVASYLGSRGIMQQRMITVGAGESRPIASNDTEAGRSENRRVEITLVPVDQGS
ncbi:MAG TPA: OmpA family protein [Lysobacter sp.]|jgi:outer membrane protein OmpA-like peptidoglycan-associated protein|nr:OmpA family protein [Lysobacter sp.]